MKSKAILAFLLQLMKHNPVFPSKRKIEQAYDRVRLSLIGLPAFIRESRDPGLQGVSGTIVKETKHMLSLCTKRGQILHVPKGIITLDVHVGTVTFRIPGNTLIGKNTTRLKKRMKKW